MLVITRKTGEGILIGEDIELTVLEATKDRVKIGIEAPQSVRIIRHEIIDTEQENKKAALPPSKNAITQFLESARKKDITKTNDEDK